MREMAKKRDKKFALRLFAIEFAIKPEFCGLPFADDGSIGDIKRFGDLGICHAAKKTHFDDFRLPVIDCRKTVKYLIDSQDRTGTLLNRDFNIYGRKIDLTTPFRRRVNSGVIDQYLPHQLRNYRVKMCPVLPRYPGAVTEFDKSLMHQSGWLQRVVGSFL